MKWVTRARPKTDRIACPWLIRRFIDPAAEILYVPAEQVLDVAKAEGAHSFDARGVEYDHRDGKCTLEVLIDAVGLGGRRSLQAGTHCPRRRHSKRSPHRPGRARPARHRGGRSRR